MRHILIAICVLLLSACASTGAKQQKKQNLFKNDAEEYEQEYELATGRAEDTKNGGRVIAKYEAIPFYPPPPQTDEQEETVWEWLGPMLIYTALYNSPCPCLSQDPRHWYPHNIN